MKQLKGIELLVFDLDGTLVNSQYDLGDALNFALFRLAKPQLAYTEIPSMLGGGLRHLISQALETTVKEEIEEAIVFFYEFYEKNHTAKTAYYTGVAETLDRLSTKKMAVLSNKPHRFTQGIVSKLDKAGHFELVMGADTEKYALKPSGEGLEIILQHFNIIPEKALMIGDSTHDIMAAKSIGMHSCAVTYGYRSKEILFEAQPDLMVDTFAALAEVID
jgi:phosphoglycolate phosphatase